MAEAPVAPVVEPRPGVVPPVTEEVAPAPEGGVDLPDDLLQIPAMQAVVAGAPAAFSANLETFSKMPESKIIAANKDGMMKAGLGLYRSLDGTQGVIFNQLFLSPDEIKAADQAGSLLEVAPPFDQLNAQVASSGTANPVLAEGPRPSGFKSGAGAAPAAAPAAPVGEIKPPGAGVQKSLASARSKNLQLGAPTSGPEPGGGRLLASILKPVI